MTLNSTKKKKEKQFLHQYYWRTVPCPCLLAHQYRLETHATSSISSSSIISFKFFCRKFFAKYWRNCSFSLWTNKCLWLVFILHRLFTARHFPSTLFLLGNDVRIRLIVFFSLFFNLDTDLLQRQVNQGGLESSGPGKTLRRRTLPSAKRGGLIIDFTRPLILLFTTLQVQQKRRR